MPEGDSIFRAARALHRALAGRTITRFESVFPRLTRVDDDRGLVGRTIDRVESRGKHLLMCFSGGLVLRTHMRMHGSWHIYRPGEAWQRPRHDMRILIGTGEFEAVAFTVPVAELGPADDIERGEVLRDLGPDPLAETFDPREALERLKARADVDIADALLDQTAIAGIGNIFKSESLFAARVSPFLPVRDVSDERLAAIVAVATKFLRANVGATAAGGIVTYGGLRRTPGGQDRVWVYRREGKPCRRCGTAIRRRKQGPHARSTYWCPTCQGA